MYRRVSNILAGVPPDVPGLLVKERRSTGTVVRVAAVGDTAFVTRGYENNPSGSRGDPFQAISGLTRRADYLFFNSECTFAEDPPCGAPFAASASHARLLADAGFSIANLANNHALDQGQAGLQSSIEALETAGIRVLGAGRSPQAAKRPLITVDRGLRIGWLAAANLEGKVPTEGYSLHKLDERALVASTLSLKKIVNCVIVSLHAGFMYIDYPSPAIRKLADALAQAGADLIVVHHPHVLQGVELHCSGAVICYSLGNLMFDWRVGNVKASVVEERQREGALWVFEIDSCGVATAVMVPTLMAEDCSLQWPGRERAEEILNRVDRISKDLRTGVWKREFNRQRAERNTGHIIRVMWFLIRERKFSLVLLAALRCRPRHLAMLIRWLKLKVQEGSK